MNSVAFYTNTTFPQSPNSCKEDFKTLHLYFWGWVDLEIIAEGYTSMIIFRTPILILSFFCKIKLDWAIIGGDMIVLRVLTLRRTKDFSKLGKKKFIFKIIYDQLYLLL